MNTRPEISVVAALRNSNYGGDLLGRAAIFLKNLVEMAKTAGLSIEVIFVEWNPAFDDARLREMLSIPERLGTVSIRVLEVGSAIHASLAGPASPPFFQPIAKNVGLRRAHGDFLLATDPDVLFTPETFQFLAKRLNKNRFYRMDRYDVASDVPPQASMPEMLRHCRGDVDAIHTAYATVQFSEPVSADDHDKIDQVLGPLRAAYNRAVAVPWYRDHAHQRLSFPIDGIHTNGSGCFLMMHKNAWSKIHGHPEFTTRGHADSVTCWSAVTAGLCQHVLQPPCLMFHQPHARDDTMQWPQTQWQPWYEEFQQCLNAKRVMRVSGADWGLAGFDLPEWQIRDGMPSWERVSASPRIKLPPANARQSLKRAA